jgi:hypothetical protein
MGDNPLPEEHEANQDKSSKKIEIKTSYVMFAALLLILGYAAITGVALQEIPTPFGPVKLSVLTEEPTSTLAPESATSEPEESQSSREVNEVGVASNEAVPEEPIASPTPADQGDSMVVISEIMFTPCGGMLHERRWSEYVELYNPRDLDIDVSGWMLSDGGAPGSGHPDSIVSWDERLEGVFVGTDLVTDSTIIPAKSFALILAPTYDDGDRPYDSAIPSGTTILTVSRPSSLLGDDDTGLVAYVDFEPDVLVLYEGTPSLIERIVSTYGHPVVSASPLMLERGGGSGFPFSLEDCGSVARILLEGPDERSNWEIVAWDRRSPGYER